MSRGVYVAAPLARVARAQAVVAELRARGVHVASSWHDLCRPGDCDPSDPQERRAALERNDLDAACATAMLALLDAGAGREVYVEIGRALASETRVVMVAERGGLPLSSADHWACVVRTDAMGIAMVERLLRDEIARVDSIASDASGQVSP